MSRVPNLFKVILLILILSGCSGLSGDISNGRYYSPNKVFSVKVPYMYRHGAKKDDNFNKDFGKGEPKFDAGGVKFSDDFGRFFRIDVFRLPEKINVNNKNVLTNTENTMLKIYQEGVIEAKIVKQEFFQLDEKTINYFITHIPRGSTIVSNGERKDVYRGALTFINEEYVYIFSTQSTYWEFKKKEAVKEHIFDEMKKYLVDSVDTFEANNKN